MTTCLCPRCGAPIPVTVASLLGVGCRSCGFAGPPPPPVLQRLEVARRELAQLDLRTRQFDERARSAVRRALRVRWATMIALAGGGLPFAALSAMGIAMGIRHEGPLPISNRFAGALFMSVPMVVYAVIGYGLHVRAVSARRQLLAACAAVPPVRPGEAASCAVCGAPLLPYGVDPVVRCDHCVADNVVHPSAMVHASAKKAMDLDAITGTLGRRAEDILATARRLTLANVGLVFGTPFAAFLSVLGMLLCAGLLERALQLAPSTLERYAWVDTRSGRCVAMITRDGHRTLAHFGENNRLPNPSAIDEDSAGLPRFAAGALVGRRLRTAGGAEGIVRRAMAAPVTNRELLVLDTGDHGTVAGSCEASD